MTKPTHSAREIAAAVTAGRMTAVDTAKAALGRIDAAKALNAVVTTDPARTLADAAAVDDRLRAGETMPLAGVPILVKDNIWASGWRITQGSRLFADFIAPQDAIAIERLRKAGAVIVGIGATSEFASKGVTTSPLFGPTRHPLDPALTPGGSSGGPATAVAAGLVPLAIGTDAGGSSRRPPAHVGVAGFKPSYGAIPYGPGFAEPFFGLSVIAPIAADVADIALAFEAMAGVDARDPDAAGIAQEAEDIAGLRIASHRGSGSTLRSMTLSPTGSFPQSRVSPPQASASRCAIPPGRRVRRKRPSCRFSTLALPRSMETLFARTRLSSTLTSPGRSSEGCPGQARTSRVRWSRAPRSPMHSRPSSPRSICC